MKLRSVVIIASILIVNLSFFNNLMCQDSLQNTSVNDSINTSLLINHLRNNFDDIHDVSMRFHHLDHRLNGVIQFKMRWENGRMTSVSVTKNETNNEEFANALAENLEKWYIQDLKGPFDISLPLRIKIVGSDDSTFSEKGILTGKILDTDGNNVSGVKLSLYSADNASDTLRSCYSNREGIFVKTLIPIGCWNIEFSATGFKKKLVKNICFLKNDHVRMNITLH